MHPVLLSYDITEYVLFVENKETELEMERIGSISRLAVPSVAQLVARRTNNRKVVGSIPANAVCFTLG